MIRIILEIDLECSRPAFAGFRYVVGPISDKAQTKLVSIIMTPLDIIVNTKQKAQIGLKPVGSDGKPFTLAAKPVWTVTTGTSGISVSDDGLSAWLISTDTQSDNVIDITVPGSDVKGQITFHCDVNVTPPPAPTLTDLGVTLLQTIDK